MVYKNTTFDPVQKDIKKKEKQRLKQLKETELSPEIEDISKKDFTLRLTKVNFKSLKEIEKIELLDYFLALCPRTELRDKDIRRGVLKFLTSISGIPSHYTERVVEFTTELVAEDAREDFFTFVKLMAERVIPNKFRNGRHIEIIAEHLQSLYESYINPKVATERLQVFLPPRSMKSVLCSILFPAWVLGRNPAFRVLLVGGTVQVAQDVFGRPLRTLIESEEYKAIFPATILDQKASSAQRFFTTAGGGFFCGGAKTGIAGRGGDFIICDDMLSEQTAFSKTERTVINNNYIPGIRSRANPGAAELLVNTRWVLDDPSGFLLKVDKDSLRPWKVVCIPAILDELASKFMRRPGDPEGAYKEGTSYWPEWKPIEELEDIRNSYLITEPYKWYALYLQNPVPQDGAIVKRTDFRFWDSEIQGRPKVTQIVVSIDTAYQETQRSDYSAVTVWGVFHSAKDLKGTTTWVPSIILLDAKKGKWDFDELCNVCEDLRREWKPDFFLVEKKQSGIGLLAELFNRGFPTIPYDPRAKKEERLQAAAVLMRGGRVWVPKDKPWAMEVVEEVCSFPSAAHDDYTDTVSMTVLWMRDNGYIRHEAYNGGAEVDFDDGDDSSNGSSFRVSKGSSSSSYWSPLIGYSK